jgi:hypothetical protein
VKRSSIVGVFVCAIALFAAALGDALVEGISNADILWHGNYTDHSSLDIFPAFYLAVVALVLTQGVSLFAQARKSGLSTRSLILSTSRVLTTREIARLLPAIFGLQLFVLFSMETTEQLAVYGHVLGGALWLGGPITVSLAIHASVTVAAALSISNALGVLGATLTRIVKCIFARFVVCARPSMALSLKPVFYALALIVTDSLVERGPPRLVKPG